MHDAEARTRALSLRADTLKRCDTITRRVNRTPDSSFYEMSSTTMPHQPLILLFVLLLLLLLLLFLLLFRYYHHTHIHIMYYTMFLCFHNHTVCVCISPFLSSIFLSYQLCILFSSTPFFIISVVA